MQLSFIRGSISLQPTAAVWDCDCSDVQHVCTATATKPRWIVGVVVAEPSDQVHVYSDDVSAAASESFDFCHLNPLSLTCCFYTHSFIN